MITVVGANKGGCSKTTTAVNIAVGLALRGEEVVLVDADIQLSASRWNAERESSGLQPFITLIQKTGNIAATLRSLDEKYKHVIVDVAGRNSRELITACTVAHQLIAPHQCSQLDLDTMLELQEQLIQVRDLNPELKAYCYQSIASTNVILAGTERNEFLEYVAEFDQLKPLNSKSCFRKVYRDVMAEGKSVLETGNEKAKVEIWPLIDEVF